MGVKTRRHRTHHISERDRLLLACGAVESSHKTIIAEFEVGRLRAFKPWEIAKISTGNKARIVDLETSWQQIGHKQTRLPFLQVVDFQNNNIALILIDPGDIGRLAIKRIISTLDVETFSTRRQ